MDATNPQATITSYWDFRSTSYDQDPGHSVRDDTELEAWRADITALLPPPPADVLDIGTGTGFMANLLARIGYRVTGVDPAVGMLAAARARSAGLASPPVFLQGDGHAPELPEGSFDAVVNRHVLWTLHDPERAFAAWLRLLRPGGRLLAIDSLWFQADRAQDPTPASTPWSEAWARHYSPEVRAALPLMEAESLDPVLSLLRSAGFVDVTVHRLLTVEAYERDHPNEWYRGDTRRYAITAVK